jgi:hypothetical protein
MESVKGNVNDPWSRRNRAKQRASNGVLSGREALVERGNKFQKDARGRGGKALFGRAISGAAGFGNYEEQRSRRNAQASEMLKSQVSTGGDATARALFARQGTDGIWRGTNGAEYTESDVRKARAQYGRDPSMYQAALTYELGKAANDTELNTTMEQHQRNMKDRAFAGAALGAGGIWAGAKYNMQGTRRELKHTAETQNKEAWVRDSRGHSQEIAETVGTYPLGNMRTSTIEALTDDYTAAKDYLATAAIANDSTRSQAEVTAAQEKLAAYHSKDGASVGEGKTRVKFANQAAAEQTVNSAVATAKTLDSRRQLSGRIVEQEGDEAPGVQSGAAGLVEERLSQFVATVRQQGDLPSGPPPRNERT